MAAAASTLPRDPGRAPDVLGRAPGAVASTYFLLGRLLRTTLRQPVWLVIMLVQPIIWLWLFGQLFRRVVTLPGFGASSYLDFLTPGVVVMTALFGAAWAGMPVITELNEGVLARMLTTPANRGAMIAARVLHTCISTVVQGVLVTAMALALGARIPSGVVGAAVMIASAALLAACFGALSTGLALLARREETLIAVVNFITLPLNFLSPVLMAAALMPKWMQGVSRFNPVAWGVTSARQAAGAAPRWGTVLGHDGLLLALAVVLLIFATWAFRAYQRSL